MEEKASLLSCYKVPSRRQGWSLQYHASVLSGDTYSFLIAVCFRGERSAMAKILLNIITGGDLCDALMSFKAFRHKYLKSSECTAVEG